MDFQIGNFFLVDSKEPIDWAKKIKDVRETHGERLQEFQTLPELYRKKYSWGNQCKNLVEKLWKIVPGMN